jgi:hypothetical protein
MLEFSRVEATSEDVWHTRSTGARASQTQTKYRQVLKLTMTFDMFQLHQTSINPTYWDQLLTRDE